MKQPIGWTSPHPLLVAASTAALLGLTGCPDALPPLAESTGTTTSSPGGSGGTAGSTAATGATGGASTTSAGGTAGTGGTGGVPQACAWEAVAPGANHTCARLDDKSLWCWGLNDHGQMGDATMDTPDVIQPNNQVAGLGKTTVKLVSGASFSCALKNDDKVSCWGGNFYGELGNGSAGLGKDSPVPTGVYMLDDVTDIAAGSTHACALKGDHSVWCWGANNCGQLGYGETSAACTPTMPGDPYSAVPEEVMTVMDVVQIVASERSTCARMSDGSVDCWGANSSAELGSGVPTETPNLAPVTIPLGAKAIDLGAGSNHVCAITNDNHVWCWGAGGDYQLGDGSNPLNSPPVQTANLTDAKKVVAGGVHTCALTIGGGVYCWGQGTYGQVGNGSTDFQQTPAQVIPSSVTAIGANSYNTCAVAGGVLSCWGLNVYGQLGIGNKDTQSLPQPVTPPPCP